jgi:hypothetical protein
MMETKMTEPTEKIAMKQSQTRQLGGGSHVHI